MRLPRLAWLAAAALIALGACRGEGDAGSRRGVPLSPQERRTTSGAIALRNLNAEISVREQLRAANPRDTKAAEALFDRLLTRGIALGRVADYERAADLAEEIVHQAPEQARSYLVRARARTALHRFREAEADLRAAERRGAGGGEIVGQRAQLLEETGSVAEALEIRTRTSAAQPDLFSLAATAALLAQRGETAAADRLFDQAQHAYRDVSPLPFAWLYFRQGRMWEEAGDGERALVFYRAAVERFPGHAPSTAGLARLEEKRGNTARAIELLRRLTETSDDPEYVGQLAEVLRRAGNDAEAEQLTAAAAARFDELVEKHPAAFAAKAARFWLGPGDDPKKALRLARVNREARGRDEDDRLVAEAEEAVRERSASRE